MAEQFRTTWRGWIKSSEGYEVRIGGRSGVDFRDAIGEIHISAERMSSPANEIVVYTNSIPDTPERPRETVLARLRRAFDSADVVLTLEDAWFE